MAKASVREISRITGFSPATVSNALNRKRSVSEETAKVILECAQSLGYQQSTQLESIQFVLAPSWTRAPSIPRSSRAWSARRVATA